MTIKRKIIGVGLLILLALALESGAMGFLNRSLQGTLNDYRVKTDQLQVLLQLNTSVVDLMATCNYAIVQTMMGEDTELISESLKGKHDEYAAVQARIESGGDSGSKIADLCERLDKHFASVFDFILAGDTYSTGADLAAINEISQEIKLISDTEKTALVADLEQSLVVQSRNRHILYFVFAGMIVVLGGLLVLTGRSIIKVNADFSGKLANSSDSVSLVSAQVSDFSRSTAEQASSQAATIEQTSASLELMSSMTRENSENAKMVDGLMADTSEVIGRASETIGQLNGAMDDIHQASAETSKIINTIDEIAFQTNLLALNAAVEAARAGDAGKGFAVVAEEVRNLAKRAAEAAQSTTGLIQQTVDKVDSGRTLVRTTNEAFGEVASSSTKVGELISEIATVSIQQAEGIEQVNAAVADMDRAVQQNAATAEESAAVSSEMNTHADQMKHYVTDFVTLMGG